MKPLFSLAGLAAAALLSSNAIAAPPAAKIAPQNAPANAAPGATYLAAMSKGSAAAALNLGNEEGVTLTAGGIAMKPEASTA